MDCILVPMRPKFLDRIPGDTRKTRAVRLARMTTPGLKAAANRARKEREVEAAAVTISRLVKRRELTLGKIRAATGLGTKTIYQAIRHHNKHSAQRNHILRHGKRYFVEGR